MFWVPVLQNFWTPLSITKDYYVLAVESNIPRDWNDIKHPLIIHSRHSITKPLIISEHTRLLHAGPTLLSASLSQSFTLSENVASSALSQEAVVIYWRKPSRPRPPLMGHSYPLHMWHLILSLFNVGIDYTSPVLIKLGAVHHLTTTKV